MSKSLNRTNYKQKVIIPKDTIKQDEIAVIEIPYEYQNEPIVVVKPKSVETCKTCNTVNTTNECLKMMNKGNINNNLKTPKSYRNQKSSFESLIEDSSLIKLDQNEMFPKLYKKIITTTITEGLDGKIKKTITTTTTQNRELTSMTKMNTSSEKVNKGTTQEHNKKEKKKQALNDTCGLHTPQNNFGMVLPDESSNNSVRSSSGDSKIDYTESNLKLHTPKNIELVIADKELELPKCSHTLVVTVPENVDKKNKSPKLDKKKYSSKNNSVNSPNEAVQSFKKVIKKTTMTKSPTNDSSELHTDIQMKKSFKPCSSIPSQQLPCSLIGQMYVGAACNARLSHCGIQDNKLNRPNQFNENQQDNKYKQTVNCNEYSRRHYNDQFKPCNNFGKIEYNQMNSDYIPSYTESVKMQQGQIYGSATNTNNQMNNEHAYENTRIHDLNQGSFGEMQPGQISYTYDEHNNNFNPCNENTTSYISDTKGNPCNIYQNNSDVVDAPLPSCISEESKHCNFLTPNKGSEVQKKFFNQVDATNKNINDNNYRVTQQNQYINNDVQEEDFIAKMSFNSNFGIQPGQADIENRNISPKSYILERAQDNSTIMQSNLVNSTFAASMHSDNSNITAFNRKTTGQSNSLKTTLSNTKSNRFSNNIKPGQIRGPVSTNAKNSIENIQTNQMSNIVGSTSTGAGDTKPSLKSSNMDIKQYSYDTNKSENFLKTSNNNSQRLMQPNQRNSTFTTNSSNKIDIESVIQQSSSSNLDSSLSSKKPEQNDNIFGSDVVYSKVRETNKQNNLDLQKSQWVDKRLNIGERNNTDSSVNSDIQQSSLINKDSKNSQLENQNSNNFQSIPTYKRTVKTTITRKTSKNHLGIPLTDTTLPYVSESLINNPTYKKIIQTTITKGPVDNNKLALLQYYQMNNYFPNSNIESLDPTKTSHNANYSNRRFINPTNLESYQAENNMSLRPPGTIGSNNYKLKYPIDYSKTLNSISGYSNISDAMGIFPHIYKGINTNRLKPKQKKKYSIEPSVSENSFGLLPSAHLNTTDYFNNNEFKSNCNETKKTFNYPQFGNIKDNFRLLPSSFLNRCISIEKSIGLLNSEFLHHKLLNLPKRPTEKKKSCNSLLQMAPVVNKSIKINDSLELPNAKLENYNSIKENLEEKVPAFLKIPETKQYALLNQRLVDQLHKAETAEKVKLQTDLKKYQQARRQLITNANILATSKKLKEFEK